jgi:Cu/Ag efflux protein CusF
MRILATACLILGLSVAAQAQSPTTRIRGEVEKAEGDTLVIKTVDGASAKVALASGYSVGGVVKATAADIKKGGYIGVGARPQADGSLLAVQVFIFPEAMRGTGEGHRPWGVLPDTTMTNATVAETVSRVDGANIMLTYPGGEQKVAITPDANIIMAVPAEMSELKAGAQVAMTATKQADGSFNASRVTIAKPGAQLPY